MILTDFEIPRRRRLERSEPGCLCQGERGSSEANLDVSPRKEDSNDGPRKNGMWRSYRPWHGVDFFPPETRRVMGLVGKSRIFTDNIPGNRLYRDICSRLLSSTHSAWLGYQRNTTVSEPQLSNTIVISIGPGANRQELHRDDSIVINCRS